tara:strand:+ start:2273 stop:2962 length:690 start_codon:yes stop_codon:yes gene_type:complete
MIVRSVAEYQASGRTVGLAGGQATSTRLITAQDGMGFSLAFVTLERGLSFDLWYKHHWETNVVLAGSARLSDTGRGDSWELDHDSVYLVGPTDRHRLEAHTPIEVLSVFCPAVNGDEVHDADGSYPPTGDTPPRQESMVVRNQREVSVTAKDDVGLTAARIELSGATELPIRPVPSAHYLCTGSGSVQVPGSGPRTEVGARSVVLVEPGEEVRFNADRPTPVVTFAAIQ